MSLLVAVADFGAAFDRVDDRAHALLQAVFDGEAVWSRRLGIHNLLEPEKL